MDDDVSSRGHCDNMRHKHRQAEITHSNSIHTHTQAHAHARAFTPHQTLNSHTDLNTDTHPRTHAHTHSVATCGGCKLDNQSDMELQQESITTDKPLVYLCVVKQGIGCWLEQLDHNHNLI